MIERGPSGQDDYRNFGAFERPPYVSGGQNGIMRCPTCGQHTPDDWKFLIVEHQWGAAGSLDEDVIELEAPQAHAKNVSVDWMRCANNECKELMIRVHESYRTSYGGAPIEMHTHSWLARPRFSQRPVDPLVPQDLRRDYEEAAAILDISPRMSAVLSRRLLADLLERYAQQSQYGITERINTFITDTSQPSGIRENLHHLREIGDFSAHTQKDDQAQIIDVGREEAEWTLEVIDRLFDYFIVGPERDKKLRAAMDAKLKAAGRKPISPPPSQGTP